MTVDPATCRKEYLVMPQCNASRMIERPPLRRHIRERGTLALHWLVLGNPALVEIAEASGAEGVVLDLQHGLWERAGLEAALRPIAGAPWRLVRLADHDRAGITTALDAGADGIIAPLVESAEQARNVVAAARFAPVGERSVGGVRPLAGDLQNYLRRAETGTAVGAMIETTAGLEAAEAIAATPELDFIFIGAGDLAVALGEFPAPGPRLAAALDRILAACRAAGIGCGIYSYNGEDARSRQAEGFAITVMTSDITAAQSGFCAAAAAYATIG
ncbi:MAG: aldolase/citrate lyase family protein [Mesorhizobium sp.]